MNNTEPTLNPLETMSLADLRLLQRTSRHPIVRHAAAAEEATRYRPASWGGCEGGAVEQRRKLRGPL